MAVFSLTLTHVALSLVSPDGLNFVVIRFSFMASTIGHIKQLIFLVMFGGLGLEAAENTLKVLQMGQMMNTRRFCIRNMTIL